MERFEDFEDKLGYAPMFLDVYSIGYVSLWINDFVLWTIPSNAKCSWRMRLHTTPRPWTMSPCLISWVDNFNWISKIVKDLHHHKAVQKFELYTKSHFGPKNQPPHKQKPPVFCLFSIFGPSKDSSQISLQIPSETKLRLVWLVRLPMRIVETARSCLAARLLFRDPKPRARGETKKNPKWPTLLGDLYQTWRRPCVC